ncbi:alpha/beta hydrolase [Streptomyces lincolnensis]|uniref:Alpha/beta hydrolase n=1 Tax=Streptomyces lincolnensis TaxID=1915 RepID=A0A1B1MPK7_STRLN|nr:hypothetical protein [Streptomyces lincolnensis]ANS70518.1 alpha/beta hydrolase [Streptomyces lincolnensis]
MDLVNHLGRPAILSGPRDAASTEHQAGPYLHRTIADIGHNLPQEAPTVFTRL